MGEALSPGHVAALARVAAWLGDARGDWWIIAGAAVALHGGWPIEVGDIDVLIGAADVPLVAALPGVRLLERGGSERFRSDFHAAVDVGGVTVEFMAGFRVRGAGGWAPVMPRSRLAIGVGAIERGAPACTVHVPALAELIDMLRSFGRPKDLTRIALLEE